MKVGDIVQKGDRHLYIISIGVHFIRVREVRRVNNVWTFSSPQEEICHHNWPVVASNVIVEEFDTVEFIGNLKAIAHDLEDQLDLHDSDILRSIHKRLADQIGTFKR